MQRYFIYVLKPVMPSKILDAIQKAKENREKEAQIIKSREELCLKYWDEIIKENNMPQNKLIENMIKLRVKERYFLIVGKRRELIYYRKSRGI